MEVEKKRSKGGFLNLFDWNGKSRKKLFSSSNELSGLKQGKENVDNLSKSQLFQLEAREDGASSSYKLNGDWDFSLTKTSDEKCGGRVPSVVARLMGLDSLPSNVPEPCSTPFLESRSVIRASHHDNSNGVWNCNSMDYIDMPNKLERFSGNLLDFRAQKVPKSPIERFQTEVLPPKSAKSIPITHHKLLSPIKSPGFTPTMNTGYLMEAATKIIEASPRKPMKSKMTSINNSSVPLRIWDLKERAETSRKSSGIERSAENYIGKNRKGKASEQNYGGSENILASRTESIGVDRSNSNASKDKGRPVSLAVQARANLQSKGDSTSCKDRALRDRKEHNEVKSSQLFKSQSSMQKTMQKRTMKRNNNILAQNNQKQNSLPNKEKLPSKPLVLNQSVKRTHSANCHIGSSKTVNKVVVNSEVELKITRTRETEAKKEFASSKRNAASRKKRSVSQDVSSEGSSVSNGLIHDGERSVKYNIAVDGSKNCDENRKLGMDIVSFTFTSPLKKSISEPHSDEAVKINHSLVFDSCSENDYLKNLSSVSPNLNVINGDALSVLLEQKLQELTCRVESSQSYMAREGIFACSGSNSQNVFATTSECAMKENDISCRYSDSPHDCDHLSTDSNELIVDKWRQFQGVKEMKEPDDSNNTETVTMSGSSVDDEFSPDDGNSIHASRLCSIQHGDAIKLDATNLYPRMLGETPVFNSTSTIDVGDKFGTLSPTAMSPINIHRSDDWELQYVREVLSKAELAFENFTLGVAPMVITPNLYNNLEIEENMKDSDGPEHFKLERKVLFDCMNECLELKAKQIVVGSSKTWVPWTKLFENGSLAEELWKEIESWKNMEEWMVDELVDKDMSTQHGKWLNFEQEANEEGFEIEKRILTSLIDELVSDFLIFG